MEGVIKYYKVRRYNTQHNYNYKARWNLKLDELYVKKKTTLLYLFILNRLTSTNDAVMQYVQYYNIYNLSFTYTSN